MDIRYKTIQLCHFHMEYIMSEVVQLDTTLFISFELCLMILINQVYLLLTVSLSEVHKNTINAINDSST